MASEMLSFSNIPVQSAMATPPQSVAPPRAPGPPPSHWLAGGAALLLALGLNLAAGRYVDRIGPGLAPARDLLHDLLPVIDMPLVHVWGFVAFLAVFSMGSLRFEPRERLPYFLWAYGLIVAVRAVCNVLTPIGLPAHAPQFDHYPIQTVFGFFDFRHAQFFSGHTAFPFLGFLLSGNRPTRLACLGFSVLLGGSVILSRLHYSIDVAAAFFITYTVYILSQPSYRAVLQKLGSPLPAE